MTREPPPTPGPSGILLIDKPEGPTSMDVCRRVRRALIAGGAPKRVKVGHGGTLDPLATGLVVVLVGKATRLCDQVMAGEKTYLAEVDLARRSATDDREGPVEGVECAPVSPDALEGALAPFRGRIMQTPPDYSAVKVSGRRAYALARRGQEVVVKPREVVVHTLELTAYRWPIAALRIECGKGTYIRSIARDLGRALGVGGMLHSLRRTSTGRFRVEDATPLDRLPALLTQADLSAPA